MARPLRGKFAKLKPGLKPRIGWIPISSAIIFEWEDSLIGEWVSYKHLTSEHNRFLPPFYKKSECSPVNSSGPVLETGGAIPWWCESTHSDHFTAYGLG